NVIYPRSVHDALPICRTSHDVGSALRNEQPAARPYRQLRHSRRRALSWKVRGRAAYRRASTPGMKWTGRQMSENGMGQVAVMTRSEECTYELQSRENL